MKVFGIFKNGVLQEYLGLQTTYIRAEASLVEIVDSLYQRGEDCGGFEIRCGFASFDFETKNPSFQGHPEIIQTTFSKIFSE